MAVERSYVIVRTGFVRLVWFMWGFEESWADTEFILGNERVTIKTILNRKTKFNTFFIFFLLV